MKETPIFRNIQHVPHIWGVTYPKLFGSLAGGLLVMTLGFIFVSGWTAIAKVLVIGLGAVVTLLLYAISLWIDQGDPFERHSTPFLKDEANSQSLSLQQLEFFD